MAPRWGWAVSQTAQSLGSGRLFLCCRIPRLLALLVALAGIGPVMAQNTPPPVSYVRSYTNDLPGSPLVTVTVTGAVGVACFTIEETLPGPASAASVSGDGVWLPALGVIRWGPYTNTVATNVSYRIIGPPASYPVNGGAWMDGQWHFSPPVLMVNAGGTPVPSLPPQVATPVFTPASGAAVPTNVMISCTTTGAVIYYTLDGSLPTSASTLYTGAVHLAAAGIVRASAFTSGWTPSMASVAYYGPPAASANARVTRSVGTNFPAPPIITLNLAPGTNATCLVVTESLPAGLGATNISAGGSYVAANNAVLWGPFFGTNTQVLSYQAAGPPGTYPVRATWSVDGVGANEPVGTNLVIAAAGVPAPPPQVAAPVLFPASGGTVPVSVSISCATPGAAIFYTTNGSLPVLTSLSYTGPVQLASAGTVLARAFTNGWTPSVASVAYYGAPAAPANAQVTRSVTTSSPTAPVVSFTMTPGAGATCVAVTETLPAGLAAANVSAGGNYIASNNLVLWGPFFGTSPQVLSYQAVGPPGAYPVRATWSVDGVGGGEVAVINLVVTSGPFPVPPPQEPMPVVSPAMASRLPVTVSLSSSDSQAQIYFTTDGSLPAPSSTPYTGSMLVTAPTTLRARAFRAGYLPSFAAAGNYVSALPTNSVVVARSLSGNGTFLPSVTLSATPEGAVSCYAVTESIALGLTPSGLSGDGVWNPFDRTIRWGPYRDGQPRVLSYHVGGQTGNYPLSGQGSFDGYTATALGAASVNVNVNSTGQNPTNLPVCQVQYLTYNVQINPAPGLITVTSASGTVDWGDGTQSVITQPVMTFQKHYTASGTNAIVMSADWTGFSIDQSYSGHATRIDTVQVVGNCVPPSIVTQPANQTVPVGAAAQFSVSATSPFPMSYQWYFNQTNPISSLSDLSTLTLPAVVPASNGLYSVVVSDAFGSVTSTLARLTVASPAATRNPDSSVTLSFLGSPNSSVRLWAATNLVPPVVWAPIFTNSDIGPAGTWQYTDTNTVGTRRRFYRFSAP